MNRFKRNTIRPLADATRISSRVALAAVASVSVAVIPIATASAQNENPGRPLIPFAGEGNFPVPEITRMSQQEAEALLRGAVQRDRLPAYEPQFVGGASKSVGSGVGIKALPAPIINSGRSWIPTGPYNLVSPRGLAPLALAGRVNAVAWDPVRTDTSGRPNLLYIATASGGLWRATINYDRVANSFAQLPKNVNDSYAIEGVQPLSDYAFPTLSTSAIAVHPTTSRIIYVGTGDYDTSISGQIAVGVGIMKSVNDGRNWIKIGDVMEGTCVSAILIDPDNTRRLAATTGRGFRPGYLWMSTDEGNSWDKGKLRNADNTLSDLPAGDWSGIDYGATFVDNGVTKRYWFATCVSGDNAADGVYRSEDSGASWRKLSVPLRFNTQGAGGLALEVAASKLGNGGRNVYVMDVSQDVRDGRIFKSIDGGNSWIETQGNYPSQNAGNYNTATFAAKLYAGAIPVRFQGNPAAVAREVLLGGNRVLAASSGVGVYNPNVVTNRPFGGGLDTGVGPEWTNISNYYLGHLDQHDVAQRPNSVAGGSAYFVAADGGGVYGFQYVNPQIATQNSFLPGTLFPQKIQLSPFFSIDNPYYGRNYLPETKGLGDFYDEFNGPRAQQGYLDINSALTAQQLTAGDFFYTNSGETRYFSGSDFLDNPKLSATLDATSPLYGGWETVPDSDFSITLGNRYIDDLNQPASSKPAAITEVTRVPDGTQPDPTDPNPIPALRRRIPYPYAGNQLGVFASSAVFDTTDLSGDTAFLWLNSGNNREDRGWGRTKLFYTNSNWQTALDITPDRIRLNYEGDPARRPADPRIDQVFVFNRTDPQDTATPAAWTDSTRPPIAQPGAMATVTQPFANIYTGGATQSLLVGTNSLWRYDPPGSRNIGVFPSGSGALHGTNENFTYPNTDHGVWRRVGNAAITSTGYITAIAPLSLGAIYVGTSSGEIYFTTLGNRQDETRPLTNLTAPWTKVNTPAAFAGHPITSIQYNPQPNNGNIDFSDIVVTLGGAASADANNPLQRVWRSINAVVTDGAGVSIARFQPASGQSAVQLPDVPTYSVTRDPDDGFNTWFVGTAVGVFATSNGGSTWANASAPLGLPNVKTNVVKIIKSPVSVADPTKTPTKWLMASTGGRGVWRFNLDNLVNNIEAPILTTEVTMNRINGQLVSTVLVRNTGGAAYDVKIAPFDARQPITSAVNKDTTYINVNGVAVVSSSFPVVNGVPQPISLGTIGKGQTQSITLRYSGNAPLRPGTLITYKIGGTYLTPPLPPGTPGTFNNGDSKRFRLP